MLFLNNRIQIARRMRRVLLDAHFGHITMVILDLS
jgi:hypothetical protein